MDSGDRHSSPVRLDSSPVRLGDLRSTIDDEAWQVQENEPALWVLLKTVNVRSRTSFESDICGMKEEGETVRGVEDSGWVRLTDEPGFIALRAWGKPGGVEFVRRVEEASDDSTGIISSLPFGRRALSECCSTQESSKDEFADGMLMRRSKSDSLDRDWSRSWLESDGSAGVHSELELGRPRQMSECFGEDLLKIAHETMKVAEDIPEGNAMCGSSISTHDDEDDTVESRGRITSDFFDSAINMMSPPDRKSVV